MAFEDQLREAIRDCGKSVYQIAKELNISPVDLYRFQNRQKPFMRSDAIGRLLPVIGYELRRKEDKKEQ